jgi:alkanesulfonate monooxygenase SsuD/methylene tetrahydromethanopterin reductase-like flavin-dependent oxidoreductase (luciferase family)
MRFGILLPSEMPAGQSPPEHLKLLREVATLAHSVGFTSAWAVHHHVSNVATFQPFPLLANLAPAVPGMVLGTGLYILPLHHPVPVAEEMATLDVLTGGHTVFGVAVGYYEPEFSVLGVPLAGRGARLTEQIRIVRALWAGSTVSVDGRHFQFENARLSLLPTQPGGPPIWIGGVSDAAISRAVRLADGWLLPPDLDPRALQRKIDVYHRELDSQGGKPLVLAAQRECLVADNRQEALAAADIYLRQNADVYAQRGMTWIRDQFDRWFDGSYLVGTWEDVAAKIERLVQLGITDIHLRVGWGDCPPDVMLRTIELMGRHVIPLFADPQ